MTDALLKYVHILVEMSHGAKPVPVPTVNLIFDVGAFNGGFGTGAAIYIQELVKQGYIKVDKVSGCSIGAAIALFFLCDCPADALSHIDKIVEEYKKRPHELKAYVDIMPAFVDAVVKTKELEDMLFTGTPRQTRRDDLYANKENTTDKHTPKNNTMTGLTGFPRKKRLYINYYDTKTHRQRYISSYRDKNHLVECLLRSAHIPYFTDGNARRNGRYMDGMLPAYTFPSSPHRCLFIKLVTLRTCQYTFAVQKEPNLHFRLMTGITDAHQFFTTGTSDMCSYVDEWNLVYSFIMRSRIFTCLLLLSLVEGILDVAAQLPSILKESPIFNFIVHKSKNLLLRE
jgi:hypothetical protein